MVDFAQLKEKSSLEKLAKKLEEKAAAEQNGFADERYWRPVVDKAGNGTALIRLLPTPPQDMERDEDALPFVKYYDHNFKGPGGWYVEKCLTTLGQPDPCAEKNNELWNTNIEANKKVARRQKRNTRYVTNIQVISHPNKPDDEGKVFLYRFGPKLKGKFDNAMNGDDDRAAFNPWNMDTGANFRLKVKSIEDNDNKTSFPNYDDSTFVATNSAVENQEKVWRSEYSLMDEVAPNKYKSYADLKARLDIVLARPKTTPTTEEVKVAPIATAETEPVNPPWEEQVVVDPNDTTLSMFEKLAEGL